MTDLTPTQAVIDIQLAVISLYERGKLTGRARVELMDILARVVPATEHPDAANWAVTGVPEPDPNIAANLDRLNGEGHGG